MSALPDWAAGYALDHIGIAVNSIAEGQAFYAALGFQALEIEEVPTEKVRVGFVELANTRIELLEPTDKDSPVGQFLEKKGPGIHHICLRVKDLRQAIAELSAKSVRLIYPEPRQGAHGCQVTFVHPKSAGGVLVELSQPATE